MDQLGLTIAALLTAALVASGLFLLVAEGMK
jgi:hypothetical protein